MKSISFSQQSAGDEIIDVARIFRILFHYKWGIVGLAFVLALMSAFVAFSMTPVYEASASIVLESVEANVVNVEEVYSLDTRNYNYAQTQYEILKSYSLAERVVRKLQLHQHSTFQSKEQDNAKPWYSIDLRALLPASRKKPPVQLTPEEKDERAIKGVARAVAGGLTVSPVSYSYVVYLGFESTDRELAAQIVNVLAEEFIASNLENRLSGTLQATDWLSERLDDLKENLRISEQALQGFRDREGLVNVGGVTGLGSGELQSLSRRLEEANKARIEAENIKEDVQGLNNASTQVLMTIPAVLQHQLIRELKREQSKVERKVAELGKRYGTKHPKMTGALSDLTAANEELGREVRKIVSGINREYEVAVRNERKLEAVWETRKSEMQDFDRMEFELQELQRAVDANRELYNIFFTRIKTVSETGGFEKPHARIIDRAMVPNSPISPNKRLIVVLTFIMGVLLGCGIAILLDMLDNTIKSPEDVHDLLDVPFLGAIPKMKLDTEGQFDHFWENPRSHYAEALRTIRTGIVLSSLDNPSKIIVVTSTEPGEGKSTTALNLGSAFGQMEKTLVIGADLRRPSLAQKCNLAPNHRGLSHYVSGTAELDDCIEYLEDMHFHVMPAGLIPPNPLEMISSEKFVVALQSLKERFDRIVIDSAPVQAVSDAFILASYADAVVYVVRADSTPATSVLRGISRMVASNEPLTGVVLNQFDASKVKKYYGEQYSQYGEYYDSAEPDSTK